MKIPFLLSALLLSTSCLAGSHGHYALNCTSESLRTHMLIELNDYDFQEEALFPQRMILSVMGSMYVLDKDMGYSFKTTDKAGQLEIYSTDSDKSHVFEVDFSKPSTAKVVIKKSINPRTGKSFGGLVLACKKSHNL